MDSIIAGTKILIVGNDPTQRSLLAGELTKEGYHVFEAVNGFEAVDIFLAEAVRLVITDLVMPQVHGFQLIEAIRARESHYTYIITLSAPDEDNSAVEALSHGADDHLAKPFSQDELLLRLKGAKRLLKLEGQDKLILAMVKLAGTRSGETGPHLDRVSAYTKILANDLFESNPQLGISIQIANDIASVSPLHDIGKIGIPDSIMHKPGPLTDEEFEIMKTHSSFGGKILYEIYEGTGSRYLKMAYEIAMFHHERWDGGGYPDGLKGEEIPLPARIMALVDAFDAITAERCYKEAFSYEKAREIVIEEKGAQFDPMIVDAYLRNEDKWQDVLNKYKEEEPSND